MIQDMLKKILAGEHLTTEEASAGMDMIMSGLATPAQIGGLLIALRQKGERAEEVAGMVHSMRGHSIKIAVSDPNAVDGCGTGGDGSHSFNISTAATLVASAAGATVAKHGNRSVSSKCGSADLLEATGGQIDPGPEKCQECINSLGFGFMYAPRFHPAMKHASSPRRELGVRTVFNILGPLTNPAGVRRQVIGVYDRRLMRLLADVLAMTGSSHVLVAHSRDGMDEFSVSAATDYVELQNGTISERTLEPEQAGLKKHSGNSLAGGDASHNIGILRRVLENQADGYGDAVALNAAALLYVAGMAGSIGEGVGLAKAAIRDGRAKDKLDAWVRLSQV